MRIVEPPAQLCISFVYVVLAKLCTNYGNSDIVYRFKDYTIKVTLNMQMCMQLRKMSSAYNVSFSRLAKTLRISLSWTSPSGSSKKCNSRLQNDVVTN